MKLQDQTNKYLVVKRPDNIKKLNALFIQSLRLLIDKS